VSVVVSDGSDAYRRAIDRWLPDADHVLDRFHLARWFASCLIEVRRRLQRAGEKASRPAFDPDTFTRRYLQVMRYDHLDDAQSARLGPILPREPQLERAWRMLQHLYGIHLARDAQEANQALGGFLELWGQQEIAEFLPAVDRLLDWAEEIFNSTAAIASATAGSKAA